jgi:hypothetical protein
VIAYTAWDGLHAIATQVDANLALRTDGRVALAPHRARADSPALRRIAARLATALAALLVAVASSAG